MNDLMRHVATRAGGSTISRFGHALGRDIYKRTPNILGGLLIGVIVAGPFFGMWYAGRKLGLNYETLEEAGAERSRSLLLAGACTALVFLVLLQLSVEFAVLSLAVLAGLFGIGFLVGVSKRTSRQTAWEVNTHNERFFEQHRFRFYPDGTMSDAENNFNRVLERHGDVIQLMALGRKNRRGYLTVDRDGRVLQWSGLQKLSG